MTEKSDLWRNRKKNGETVVILHSCRTGRDNYNGVYGKAEKSFAKRMSKAFKNVKFIAPTERLVINTSNKGTPEENSVEVGTRVAKYSDSQGDYLKDKNGKDMPHVMSDESGSWNIYQNGEVIGSFSPGNNAEVKTDQSTTNYESK